MTIQEKKMLKNQASFDRLITFPVEDILPLIGKLEKFKYKNFQINLYSHRLLCFKRNLKCAFCNRTGKFFALERSSHDVNPHFNLYSRDGMLMTRDHIIPVSYGGKNGLHNSRTMCLYCNNIRGNDFPWNDWWYFKEW